MAPTTSVRQFLHQLLTLTRSRSAAAVALQTGAAPALRIDGADMPVSSATMSAAHMAAVCEALLDAPQRALLATTGRAETSLPWTDLGRFQVVVRRRDGACSLDIAPLPLALPDFGALMLPPDVCNAATAAPRGLVLVAGGTAARAAVLAAFARQRALQPGAAVHVADAMPAYSFEHAAVAISVATPANDVLHWVDGHAHSGLAAVLLGDIQGRSAWQRAAVLARQVLCLASVPVDDLMAMFGCIDDLPTDAGQVPLLAAVANPLQVAIGIRCVRAGASGRAVHASELMVCTPEARTLLREGRFGGLLDLMRESGAQGMRTRDQHLLQLVEAQQISHGDALRHAQRADQLRMDLRLQSVNVRSRDLLAGTVLLSVEAGAAEPPAASSPRPPPPAPDLESLLGAGRAAPADPSLTGGAPAGTDPLLDLDAFDDERAVTLGSAARQPEGVQFRAYTPPHIAPGTLVLVDIWACLPSQATEVAALAASTAQTLQAGLRTGVALERDVAITVRLKAEGLQVRPFAQTMLWTGEPCNVSFEVHSPTGQAPGAYPARARLLANGVTVGELHFLLQVRSHASDGMRSDNAATVRYVRSAFASYATPDRPEMLARIQGMKKIAPDLDVFVDAISLRSGQRWQQRIEEEVQRRERLFLFWSRQACSSEWVDFEWRLAHRLRGLEAIDPVPLDDPSAAPPPHELSALHFGDAYLAHIRQARQSPP